MSVLLILILASLGMALLFLGGFVWAVRTGQFEDTCTPSFRILSEDDRRLPAAKPQGPATKLSNPDAD
jgi:cbb3-type cytochrome oxidase maturation protein